MEKQESEVLQKIRSYLHIRMMISRDIGRATDKPELKAMAFKVEEELGLVMQRVEEYMMGVRR